MDEDLVLIFGFILVILMFVLPFAYMVHRRTVEHEERKLDLLARAKEAEGGKGGAAYRKLEERVRVLERIATDSNHALASQIEQLRDMHEIEDQTQARDRAREKAQ